MNTFTHFLSHLGLSEKESLVYQCLLAQGRQTVASLSANTQLKRGDLYNILYSLRDMGLVATDESKGVATFTVCDPHNLKNQITIQKNRAEEAALLAESIMPQLISQYTLSTNKPSIRYLEGVEGFRAMYGEFFKSGEKQLRVMRSIYDSDRPEILAVIREAREKQIENGITMRLISPLQEKTKRRFLETDGPRNIVRRIVEPDQLICEAQILLWGNTAAIVSLKNEVVITLIENADSAQTLNQMFEYIWKSSEAFHNKMVKEWELA